MKNLQLLDVVCAVIFVVATTTANAELVVPAGLNPGDKYHVIFTTKQTTDATSSSISYYDNFVQSAADAAGIGSTIGLHGWLAIGSTETVDAYDRLASLFSSTTNVPIYNQLGELVAASYASLWGTELFGVLNYDENGNVNVVSVWTGTEYSDGYGATGNELGKTFTMYGTSEATGRNWLSYGTSDNFINRALYALSEEVSVPVIPLPPAPLEGRLPATPGGTVYQAYYDPNLNITWATDANINGLDTWDNQMAWVADMVIGGVSGWRLPSADVNGDRNIADCVTGLGDICADHEMAYLFHIEGISASTPGPFNIPFNPNSAAFHWSGTEFDSDEARDFSFHNGDSAIGMKSADDYAWAVHDGDVGALNTPPIADAGPDQSLLQLGTTVQLDGSQSIDPDGDPITFQWQLAVPTDSGAVLDDPTSATPSFIADLYGDYIGTLSVTDDKGASSQDEVTVGFQNIKPVAEAGDNQAALVGDTVMLDGSGSSDVNGDILTFQWSVNAAPTGSIASISNSTTVNPSVVPDLPGTYIISLVVNDGLLNSDPDTTEILAVSLPNAATAKVMEAISVINSLDISVFKSVNARDLLTRKLNKALADIAAGRYMQAIGTLEHNVLSKTDGCAISGTVENNDWIVTCDAQAQVYPLIVDAIGILNRL